MQNNVLHGGARGALEYDNDSSFISDYNLMRRAGSAQLVTNEDAGVVQTLAQWRAASGNDIHSVEADPLFVSSAAPFDFHAQSGSPALDSGNNRPDVTVDIEGTARPQNTRWDLGCYERAGTAPPPPPPPPPAEVQAPTNLRATGGSRLVTLAWTQSPSPNIVQNRIYRSRTPGGPYTRIATVSARTSYVNTGLSRRVTYYYRVTAVDASGNESAYSNEATARTQ